MDPETQEVYTSTAVFRLKAQEHKMRLLVISDLRKRILAVLIISQLLAESKLPVGKSRWCGQFGLLTWDWTRRVW